MACFRLEHRVKTVIICLEAVLQQQQQAVMLYEMTGAADRGKERSGRRFTVDEAWMS